jgi:tripeptidyl-peptidase II
LDVYIENRSGNPRGVYLRQADESSVRQTYAVHVDPCFRKDDVAPEMQRRRIEFEMEFDLTSTESWVNAPEHFMLMHNGRTFKIEVDPTQLPPGVHTAKVLALADGVVMFSVPITVLKPLAKDTQIDLGKLEVRVVLVR